MQCELNLFFRIFFSVKRQQNKEASLPNMVTDSPHSEIHRGPLKTNVQNVSFI